MYGQYKYGEYRYGEDVLQETERNFIPVKLLDYLTSNYQDGINIQKLMSIIDLELGELRYYANTLGDQANIKKVTWGVNTWEEELAIDYNPTMSLESRKEVILAKIRGRGNTTKQMIINVAEAFSGGEVNVIEYPEESYFVIQFIGVRGIPRNMQSFINMLNSIKPAHLGYEFKYSFTTCQMLIDWNVINSDLTEVTCKDLKIYNKKFNKAFSTCQYLLDNNLLCNDIKILTCIEIRQLGRREII